MGGGAAARVGLVLDTALGVLLGIALAAVIFVWVLPETYQSVDLPATPLPLRVVAVAAGWLLLAAGLGSARPVEPWRWGVRLVIPSAVIFGIGLLLDRGVGGLLLAVPLFVALGAWGALGGYLGARMRRHASGSAA